MSGGKRSAIRSGEGLLTLLLMVGPWGCGSEPLGAVDGSPTGEIRDPTDALTNPFEGGTMTMGLLCTGEAPSTRIVFSRSPGRCEDHAALLTEGGAEDHAIILAPHVAGPTQFEGNAQVCLEGSCQTRAITVSIDAYGPNEVLGSWGLLPEENGATMTVGGPLRAELCSYSAARPDRPLNLATDIDISEVAIYQGVKVPLMGDEADLVDPPPVIEGRPGLLRVFVEPRPGFRAQQVTAELEWDPQDGEQARTLTDSLRVLGRSLELAQGTTFDFRLDGRLVVDGAEWSVRLRAEERCGEGSSVEAPGASWPSEGRAVLESRPVGVLNVVLVPFRYDADGSRRLPDISEEQVALYRQKLMSMYPVEDVVVTVREPVPWARPIRQNGTGWSEVLVGLFEVRARDNPPRPTYYYGIFSPTETERDYGGGVAGLATVPGPGDASARGAVGLGFSGETSANTCAHELGHAAGRLHSPCGRGVRNVDPRYPREYEDASIGTWGYDITNGRLKNPSQYRDLMSYCTPEWISDYTYRALYERLSFVLRASSFRADPPERVRMIAWSGGTHHWSNIVEMFYPSGEDVAVRYLDASGAVLADRHGVEFGLDHLDDTVAVIPEAPPGTVSVRIGPHPVVTY